MSIQFVGEVRYNPARDFVHVFPSVIETLTERLRDESFSPLHKWLSREGFSAEDLCHGLQAYIRFMELAQSDRDLPMHLALVKSGYMAVPWQVQTAVMFYAGATISGVYFHGLREATCVDRPTVPTLTSLIEAGKRLTDYLSTPRWKRRRPWRWFFRTKAQDNV